MSLSENIPSPVVPQKNIITRFLDGIGLWDMSPNCVRDWGLIRNVKKFMVLPIPTGDHVRQGGLTFDDVRVEDKYYLKTFQFVVEILRLMLEGSRNLPEQHSSGDANVPNFRFFIECVEKQPSAKDKNKANEDVHYQDEEDKFIRPNFVDGTKSKILLHRLWILQMCEESPCIEPQTILFDLFRINKAPSRILQKMVESKFHQDRSLPKSFRKEYGKAPVNLRGEEEKAAVVRVRECVDFNQWITMVDYMFGKNRILTTFTEEVYREQRKNDKTDPYVALNPVTHFRYPIRSIQGLALHPVQLDIQNYIPEGHGGTGFAFTFPFMDHVIAVPPYAIQPHVLCLQMLPEMQLAQLHVFRGLGHKGIEEAIGGGYDYDDEDKEVRDIDSKRWFLDEFDPPAEQGGEDSQEENDTEENGMEEEEPAASHSASQEGLGEDVDELLNQLPPEQRILLATIPDDDDEEPQSVNSDEEEEGPGETFSEKFDKDKARRRKEQQKRRADATEALFRKVMQKIGMDDNPAMEQILFSAQMTQKNHKLSPLQIAVSMRSQSANITRQYEKMMQLLTNPIKMIKYIGEKSLKAAVHKDKTFEERSLGYRRHVDNMFEQFTMYCTSPESTVGEFGQRILGWAHDHIENVHNFHLVRKPAKIFDKELSIFGNFIASQMETFEHIFLISTAHLQMLEAKYSALDAYCDRMGLHLNMFLTGEALTSKSFIFNLLAWLFIVDTVKTYLRQTQCASQVSRDRNDHITCMHEVPLALFAPDARTKLGTEQEANLKEVLTSQIVRVLEFFYNENNIRDNREIVSECQGCFFMASNDKGQTLPFALRTRFSMHDFGKSERLERDIQAISASESLKTAHNYSMEDYVKHLTRREQYLQWIVEKLICVKALPDVTLAIMPQVLLKLESYFKAKKYPPRLPRTEQRATFLARKFIISYALHMLLDIPTSEYYDKPFKISHLKDLAPLLHDTEEVVTFVLGMKSNEFCDQNVNCVRYALLKWAVTVDALGRKKNPDVILSTMFAKRPKENPFGAPMAAYEPGMAAANARDPPTHSRAPDQMYKERHGNEPYESPNAGIPSNVNRWATAAVVPSPSDRALTESTNSNSNSAFRGGVVMENDWTWAQFTADNEEQMVTCILAHWPPEVRKASRNHVIETLKSFELITVVSKDFKKPNYLGQAPVINEDTSEMSHNALKINQSTAAARSGFNGPQNTKAIVYSVHMSILTGIDLIDLNWLEMHNPVEDFFKTEMMHSKSHTAKFLFGRIQTPKMPNLLKVIHTAPNPTKTIQFNNILFINELSRKMLNYDQTEYEEMTHHNTLTEELDVDFDTLCIIEHIKHLHVEMTDEMINEFNGFNFDKRQKEAWIEQEKITDDMTFNYPTEYENFQNSQANVRIHLVSQKRQPLVNNVNKRKTRLPTYAFKRRKV